jgi:hypothetical protein
MHEATSTFGRFNHVFRSGDIDPVGIAPRGPRRHQGTEMNDGLVTLSSSEHRFSITKISKNFCTVQLTRFPLEARHLVATSHQQRSHRPSKKAGAASEKYFHWLTGHREML